MILSINDQCFLEEQDKNWFYIWFRAFSLLIRFFRTLRILKMILRDIANQLWVQIFQRLFYIYDSIRRIKVLETVLARCTITESRLYNDIWTLFDFQDEEFDLVSREACLPDIGVSKLENDDSILLKSF